ncbi:MAG: GxxExxY protein [Spirochaetota bacterium]
MKNIRDDLIYPELSYKLVGILFDVYNCLGAGHPEKYYQKAISEELKSREISFQEQVYYPLKYKNKIIGQIYLDFLVDNKVVLEIKKNSYFSKKNIDQVLNYLKLFDKKLAILANFSKEGVLFKRIVNV